VLEVRQGLTNSQQEQERQKELQERRAREPAKTAAGSRTSTEQTSAKRSCNKIARNKKDAKN